MVRIAIVLVFASVLAVCPAVAQSPPKDQTQLPQSEEPGQAPQPQAPQPETDQAPVQPPASGEDQDLTQPAPAESGDETDTEDSSPDDLSYGEIPDVTVIELTEDIARRSLDALALVRDKYKDANLENFESLQDFVDQTDEGKKFEADLKAAGFASVDEWNVAVTSVSFAYSAITDNLTDDLTNQIAEIEKDTSLAQDMKDRMIKGLKAMIPSENNKKVVQALIDDPSYSEKLKLLSEEGE